MAVVLLKKTNVCLINAINGPEAKTYNMCSLKRQFSEASNTALHVVETFSANLLSEV